MRPVVGRSMTREVSLPALNSLPEYSSELELVLDFLNVGEIKLLGGFTS